jgi:hypothetical protein
LAFFDWHDANELSQNFSLRDYVDPLSTCRSEQKCSEVRVSAGVFNKFFRVPEFQRINVTDFLKLAPIKAQYTTRNPIREI